MIADSILRGEIPKTINNVDDVISNNTENKDINVENVKCPEGVDEKNHICCQGNDYKIDVATDDMIGNFAKEIMEEICNMIFTDDDFYYDITKQDDEIKERNFIEYIIYYILDNFSIKNNKQYIIDRISETPTEKTKGGNANQQCLDIAKTKLEEPKTNDVIDENIYKLIKEEFDYENPKSKKYYDHIINVIINKIIKIKYDKRVRIAPNVTIPYGVENKDGYGDFYGYLLLQYYNEFLYDYIKGENPILDYFVNKNPSKITGGDQEQSEPQEQQEPQEQSEPQEQQEPQEHQEHQEPQEQINTTNKNEEILNSILENFKKYLNNQDYSDLIKTVLVDLISIEDNSPTKKDKIKDILSDYINDIVIKEGKSVDKPQQTGGEDPLQNATSMMNAMPGMKEQIKGLNDFISTSKKSPKDISNQINDKVSEKNEQQIDTIKNNILNKLSTWETGIKEIKRNIIETLQDKITKLDETQKNNYLNLIIDPVLINDDDNLLFYIKNTYDIAKKSETRLSHINKINSIFYIGYSQTDDKGRIISKDKKYTFVKYEGIYTQKILNILYSSYKFSIICEKSEFPYLYFNGSSPDYFEILLTLDDNLNYSLTLNERAKYNDTICAFPGDIIRLKFINIQEDPNYIESQNKNEKLSMTSVTDTDFYGIITEISSSSNVCKLEFYNNPEGYLFDLFDKDNLFDGAIDIPNRLDEFDDFFSRFFKKGVSIRGDASNDPILEKLKKVNISLKGGKMEYIFHRQDFVEVIPNFFTTTYGNLLILMERAFSYTDYYEKLSKMNLKYEKYSPVDGSNIENIIKNNMNITQKDPKKDKEEIFKEVKEKLGELYEKLLNYPEKECVITMQDGILLRSSHFYSDYKRKLSEIFTLQSLSNTEDKKGYYMLSETAATTTTTQEETPQIKGGQKRSQNSTIKRRKNICKKSYKKRRT